MSQVFPSKYEGILPARHAKPKGRITELLHILAHVVKAAFHLATLVLGLFTCCSKWVTLTEFGWIGIQNKWHMTTIIPLTRSTRVQKKEIYLCNNPLVRKRSTNLTIHSQVGVQFSKPVRIGVSLYLAFRWNLTPWDACLIKACVWECFVQFQI